MREADEPSRGRVLRPMPETGPGAGQADVPEMRQVPVSRRRGHVRQVPGAPWVAVLFSLRRAAAEGFAGRVVRPMPVAPFGEGEDMNLADVALEALYVLGVVLCCALLSREEGSREGLGSRRARLFMLALAVEAMQAGLGSLAFREPWGAPFAPLAGVRSGGRGPGGPVPRTGPVARRRESRSGLPVTRTAGHSSRSCSCSTSKRILSRVRPRRAWRAARLRPPPFSRRPWRVWRPHA